MQRDWRRLKEAQGRSFCGSISTLALVCTQRQTQLCERRRGADADAKQPNKQAIHSDCQRSLSPGCGARLKLVPWLTQAKVARMVHIFYATQEVQLIVVLVRATSSALVHLACNLPPSERVSPLRHVRPQRATAMRVERACTFGHEKKKGANRVSSGGNNRRAGEMVAHNGAMLHIATVVRVVHCAVAG